MIKQQHQQQQQHNPVLIRFRLQSDSAPAFVGRKCWSHRRRRDLLLSSSEQSAAAAADDDDEKLLAGNRMGSWSCDTCRLPFNFFSVLLSLKPAESRPLFPLSLLFPLQVIRLLAGWPGAFELSSRRAAVANPPAKRGELFPHAGWRPLRHLASGSSLIDRLTGWLEPLPLPPSRRVEEAQMEWPRA